MRINFRVLVSMQTFLWISFDRLFLGPVGKCNLLWPTCSCYQASNLCQGSKCLNMWSLVFIWYGHHLYLSYPGPIYTVYILPVVLLTYNGLCKFWAIWNIWFIKYACKKHSIDKIIHEVPIYPICSIKLSLYFNMLVPYLGQVWNRGNKDLVHVRDKLIPIIGSHWFPNTPYINISIPGIRGTLDCYTGETLVNRISWKRLVCI